MDKVEDGLLRLILGICRNFMKKYMFCCFYVFFASNLQIWRQNMNFTVCENPDLALTIELWTSKITTIYIISKRLVEQISLLTNNATFHSNQCVPRVFYIKNYGIWINLYFFRQTTNSQVKNGYAKIDEWEKCLDDGTFCDTIRSEIVGNLSSNSMFQLSYMTLDSIHNPYPRWEILVFFVHILNLRLTIDSN